MNQKRSTTIQHQNQSNSQSLLKILREVINHMNLDTKKRPLLMRLKWIDNVQFVGFSEDHQNREEIQKMKLDEIVCSECDCPIKNLLLLLLHCKLAHDSQTFTFTICEDWEMLLITKEMKAIKKDSPHRDRNSNVIYNHCDVNEKMSTALLQILSKLEKRDKVPPKRAFYHCLNNYKEISKDSSDSQQQDGAIMTHHLQQRKMKQLQDISASEMRFFILWNQFVHDLKKEPNGSIGIEKKVVSRMGEFFQIEEVGEMKYHLLTHLNILLSYGVLNSDQFIGKVEEFHAVQEKMRVGKLEGEKG